MKQRLAKRAAGSDRKFDLFFVCSPLARWSAASRADGSSVALAPRLRDGAPLRGLMARLFFASRADGSGPDGALWSLVWSFPAASGVFYGVSLWTVRSGAGFTARPDSHHG